MGIRAVAIISRRSRSLSLTAFNTRTIPIKVAEKSVSNRMIAIVATIVINAMPIALKRSRNERAARSISPEPKVGYTNAIVAIARSAETKKVDHM
jgi:hypothetical protein